MLDYFPLNPVSLCQSVQTDVEQHYQFSKFLVSVQLIALLLPICNTQFPRQTDNNARSPYGYIPYEDTYSQSK